MRKSDFKGLAKAAKDFNNFRILGSLRDPGYGYDQVFLLRIRFDDGAEGLCIYDTKKERFIEEPDDYEGYGTTQDKVMTKHPGLFVK